MLTAAKIPDDVTAHGQRPPVVEHCDVLHVLHASGSGSRCRPVRAPEPTTIHSLPTQPAPWADDSRSSVKQTPGPDVRLPVINQPVGPPAIGPTLVAVTPPYCTKLAGTSTRMSPSIRKDVTRGLPCAPPERAPTATRRSRDQATESRIARRPQ